MLISHSLFFLSQYNHKSITSNFLHSLCAMHSGKIRGGVWCRETLECTAALTQVCLGTQHCTIIKLHSTTCPDPISSLLSPPVCLYRGFWGDREGIAAGGTHLSSDLQPSHCPFATSCLRAICQSSKNPVNKSTNQKTTL